MVSGRNQPMPSATQRTREVLLGRAWAIAPIVLSALLTVLYVLLVAIGAARSGWSGTLADYLFLVVGAISVALAFRTASFHHGDRRAFRAWILVAVSLLSFWGGELGWLSPREVRRNRVKRLSLLTAAERARCQKWARILMGIA